MKSFIARTLVCAALVLSPVATFAQTAVPFTFTAGTAAKATEVNADFQALVGAINQLGARVAKLEGSITSADLAGTYAVNALQVELGQNATAITQGRVFTGTATVAANGTFTLTNNTEKGARLNVGMAGTQLSIALTAVDAGSSSFSGTWSYANGVLSLLPTGASGAITASVSAGGRLAVLVQNSPSPSGFTQMMMLLTRLN